MKKLKFTIGAYILLAFLVSCNNKRAQDKNVQKEMNVEVSEPEPLTNKYIGTYNNPSKTTDGLRVEKIVINEDGTVRAYNKKGIEFYGSWEAGDDCIYLSINNTKTYNDIFKIIVCRLSLDPEQNGVGYIDLDGTILKDRYIYRDIESLKAKDPRSRAVIEKTE